MNHPSIGGKEQTPQSSDVPKKLLDDASEALAGALGRWYLIKVLRGVPPGWMKTEQGWVQMELSTLSRLNDVYRVKQPSEDHPAG